MGEDDEGDRYGIERVSVIPESEIEEGMFTVRCRMDRSTLCVTLMRWFRK